jgi:hypothetical protein
MTVNDDSYLELENGHYLEESNLTFDLTVSQDSALFNHGGVNPGTSVNVGNYTEGETYDVLNFNVSHDVIGEDLDLSAAGNFYASGDVIYSSSDLLEVNEIGYIGSNGEVVIDGDCVGELDGIGNII